MTAEGEGGEERAGVDGNFGPEQPSHLGPKKSGGPRPVFWFRILSKTQRLTNQPLRTSVLLQGSQHEFVADPILYFKNNDAEECLKVMTIIIKAKHGFTMQNYSLQLQGTDVLEWLKTPIHMEWKKNGYPDFTTKFRRAKFAEHLLNYVWIRFRHEGDKTGELYLIHEQVEEEKVEEKVEDIPQDDLQAMIKMREKMLAVKRASVPNSPNSKAEGEGEGGGGGGGEGHSRPTTAASAGDTRPNTTATVCTNTNPNPNPNPKQCNLHTGCPHN